MLATTSFDLSLDSKIFAVLNEKFNADKIAINRFINNTLNKIFKAKTKKKEGLSFDDLNEETQKAILDCEKNGKNLKYEGTTREYLESLGAKF
ncbi:MAG: hypothetical protein Ta2D_10340 [Rickettsiales bacterium]|nr:MAG: hypothetical protein Ta2D_10340 [Rickettsiales bacterium]